MKLDSKHLNWGAISALVVIALLVVYDSFAPMPGDDLRGPKKSASELKTEREKARQRLQEVEGSINGLTWKLTADEVGPAAMAWVSEQAVRTGIDVSAFRPQRTEQVEGLTQTNYLLTAEGPFLAMMQFIKVFEGPDSLLAVKAVQMASSDGASDLVRATVSLSAYREGDGG